MLVSTLFRKNSRPQEQEDVEQEVKEATDSLSRLLQIAQLRSKSHAFQTEMLIDDAIRKLEVLQERLARHKELIDLVQLFESEISKKTEGEKKRESELEQCIVQANMQRVILLTQRDEVANQLAITRRELQQQQSVPNPTTCPDVPQHAEHYIPGPSDVHQCTWWDSVLDIDESDNDA